MTEDKRKSIDLARLRERANAQLERESLSIPELSPEDVRRLVYDLRTYQIELELQNEELRRAQEELIDARDRYADLYDFAPVGYVTVSQQGMIQEANLTLAEMLRVERRRLIEHPLSAFILPDDQDIFYRHRRTVFESKSRDTCRLRLVKVDAQPLWVDMESILTGHDDAARLRTVISDVTERKRAEAEKQTLEHQLQHAQKLESLGVLAGGIAHDFNNLLMAILGNADLAMHELPAMSPACKFLQEIEKASRRAAELANQMLSYSGKGGFVVEEIDLTELVEEMGHMLEVTTTKKTLLQYKFSDKPVAIIGDVTQIRQVVMNLITNASEAIGDETGEVVLTTGTIHCDRAYLDEFNEIPQAGLGKPLPEGDYAYLEVADTGCGMDPQTIDKIFDPFFTTKFSGRGLGMSAVLGIVQGHKGALAIKSEVGKGTTFTVVFPQVAPGGTSATSPGASSIDAKAWRGDGTVLLVDDEESVRGVGKAMLIRLGFTVLTAPDGREALKIFKTVRGELAFVLLDLTMPDMNGEETFRALQRIQPDVTVILCSGYDEQAITKRFGSSDLAGFIRKPFDMAALQDAIRHAMGD